MQFRTKLGLYSSVAALLLAGLSSGCGEPAMTINDINNEAEAVIYEVMQNKGYELGKTFEQRSDTIGSGYFVIVDYDEDGKAGYDKKKVIRLPIGDATKEAIRNAVVSNLSSLPVYIPEPEKPALQELPIVKEQPSPEQKTVIIIERPEERPEYCPPVIIETHKYRAPTESEARDAMGAAINRAASCFGLVKNKDYKDKVRTSSLPSCYPDVKVEIRRGGIVICMNYERTHESSLDVERACCTDRINITEEKTRRNRWTQDDLEREYFEYLYSVFDRICDRHKRCN